MPTRENDGRGGRRAATTDTRGQFSSGGLGFIGPLPPEWPMQGASLCCRHTTERDGLILGGSTPSSCAVGGCVVKLITTLTSAASPLAARRARHPFCRTPIVSVMKARSFCHFTFGAPNDTSGQFSGRRRNAPEVEAKTLRSVA